MLAALNIADELYRCRERDRARDGELAERAGAIERMHRKLLKHSGQEPALLMSGGAAVKLASISDLHFETVERLIFDGLLQFFERF